MTDAQLIAMFDEWRADIDSVPFAHETRWQVGDLTEVTR